MAIVVCSRTDIRDLVRPIRDEDVLAELYEFAENNEIYGILEALQEMLIVRSGNEQQKAFLQHLWDAERTSGKRRITAEEMFESPDMRVVQHLHQFGLDHKLRKMAKIAMWEILRRTEPLYDFYREHY